MKISNSVRTAPTDAFSQLQWLVDRASISEVISAFARSMDEKDWEAYGRLMDEGATFSINGRTLAEGRDASVAAASGAMGRFFATWHHLGSPAIEVNKHTAKARCYSVGVHRLNDSDPGLHSSGAGWYDCEFRRSDAGWLLTSIELSIIWTAGEGDRPA